LVVAEEGGKVAIEKRGGLQRDRSYLKKQGQVSAPRQLGKRTSGHGPLKDMDDEEEGLTSSRRKEPLENLPTNLYAVERKAKKQEVC